MSQRFPKWAETCVRNIVLTASLAASASAVAQSDGPFALFGGGWVGTGKIVATDGTSERIRCKVHYYVGQQGRDLNQQLRCASDSYHFDVNSALLDDGSGRITGSWTETNRNAVGKVNGQADGNGVRASVVGTGFTASLSVALHGDKQTVRILPTGADIASVAIDFHRE
jgi:hypothetical protein